MSAQDFLFEIGGEELPPKSLLSLATALHHSVCDALTQAQLPHGRVQFFAAPRRLAILITELADRQPDRTERVDGPPLKAAFDAQGQPTAAALGFARKVGVDLAAIERGEDKLRFVRQVPGERTVDFMPRVFEQALKNLPIAKRMRWGAQRVEFVRPMHWVVMLYGADIVPATLLEIPSGRCSHGHRFHHPDAVTFAHASEYVAVLREAHVIADFDERRQLIEHAVHALAAAEGGRALMPLDLLNEVTALVEWPVPLVCSFESRFLTVPQEALISTMQDNQKYFCLVDSHGQLMARFITVANIDSPSPEKIIAGNEKVVRPRLTDAAFFFEQDKKVTLNARRERLKQIIFQAQLGTVFDKTERVAQLAAVIAERLGADPAQARLAGQLCKSDLASELVTEFPELQGIAGFHYARHEGLPEPVALALQEQYLPRFSGDVLPTGPIGQAVALADKIDTLVGIFGIGQRPTGSKDPFALRRAALGVLRILIEGELACDVTELVAQARHTYGDRLTAPDTEHEVNEFFLGRYRAMYEDQGFAVDVIQAVQACRPTDARDFDRRVRALAAFQARPEASALAAANKRVANLLAKTDVPPGEIETDQMTHDAERHLHQAIQSAAADVVPWIRAGQYAEALNRLAALRAPLDAFFEQVMVNDPDDVVRANRLRLISWVRSLFLRIADVSVLNAGT